MEHLPARTGEARERQLYRGGSESRRSSSGNLREDILEITNLPTPTVSDLYTANLSSTQQKEGSLHSVTLAQVFHREDLFPTPVASEGFKAPAQQDAETKGKTGQVWLSNVAKGLSNDNLQLMPTTTASDWKGANNSGSGTTSSNGIATVADNLPETSWGKFEPAIRRWEQVIGRPAPEPTKPDGKEGNHRLSSAFTEWMMGVPEGWITGAGISRNEELKAAGNGVVPQQAELALRILLAQTDFINDIE